MKEGTGLALATRVTNMNHLAFNLFCQLHAVCCLSELPIRPDYEVAACYLWRPWPRIVSHQKRHSVMWVLQRDSWLSFFKIEVKPHRLYIEIVLADPCTELLSEGVGCIKFEIQSTMSNKLPKLSEGTFIWGSSWPIATLYSDTIFCQWHFTLPTIWPE